MSLIPSLLHTITRLWDFNGKPPKMILELSKKDLIELFNYTFGNKEGMVGSVDAKTGIRYIEFHGYTIELKEKSNKP